MSRKPSSSTSRLRSVISLRELKCASGRLLGMLDGKFVEIACRSARCGKRPGVVVIHRFDVLTGECVSTSQFKEARITKGEADGTCIQGAPLRSA
jgi:hypothetical protein